MICLVSMSAGVSCRAVQRVCGGSASSRVEVRAAPGETGRGRGSGNRACSQHQREQAARNTTRQHVFVSRTCVGVGVELSNVKRSKTLYIRRRQRVRRMTMSMRPMSVLDSTGYGTATGQGRNGQPYDTGAADHVNLHDENRQHSRCRDWNYDSNNRM